MAAPTAASLDQLVMAAINVYKSVEPFLELKDKVQGGLDAYGRASHTLATGEIQAYDENIETARVKVKRLKRTLGGLARQDENYWIEKSSANLLQRAQTQQAVSWLQQRLQEFNGLANMVEAQRPLVQALKKVLENPAGMAVKMAIEPTSLHGLDIIALGEIDGNLGGCAADLKQIRMRVQTATNALSWYR